MKFWELVSLFRDDRGQLQKVLQAHSDRKYADWLQDFAGIVSQQQREKLDAVVPKQLCEAVLSSHKGKLYKTGTKIRSYRMKSTDVEVSYLEVFRMFGGAFLEEVLEKGSAER